MCNRSIKFGAFWKQAQADGADYIATGHYAQNIEKESAHALMRGVDPEKDQSYFLWTLTQDDLSHALFPIGENTSPKYGEWQHKQDCRMHLNETHKDSVFSVTSI